MGEFGETIVIDWGLAKDLSAGEEAAVGGGPFRRGEDGLTAAGAVLGTPPYMAPEQQRGDPVDQRADVFAIGAMLWELCALERPADARERHRVLRGAGIARDLAAIIEKALAHDPQDRYRDAGALAADLKAFKSGARIAARSYSPVARLVHAVRRPSCSCIRSSARPPACSARGIPPTSSRGSSAPSPCPPGRATRSRSRSPGSTSVVRSSRPDEIAGRPRDDPRRPGGGRRRRRRRGCPPRARSLASERRLGRALITDYRWLATAGTRLAAGTRVTEVESRNRPRRSGRVLIVDDDPSIRGLMQDVLERRGFDVVAVESGAEALGYLARDTASLILLDLEMDDVNGWEVLTMLKRHPAFGSFRVIVVTGTNGTVPKWAGHLRKPFRVDALLDLVENDPAPDGGPRARASEIAR